MQLAPSSASSAPTQQPVVHCLDKAAAIPSDPNDSHFDSYVGRNEERRYPACFPSSTVNSVCRSMPPIRIRMRNTPVTFGNADSGSYDIASGVVTITISNSKFRSIDGGATKYVANTSLGAINVRTYLARLDAGQKSQTNASDITGNGAYTLVGNAFCYVNRLPVASLSASPTQGFAPLTVSFNGSGSTDADGSVTSYTFTFGDGSASVTQSTPTIQHTYNNAGDTFATLTVKDNTGAPARISRRSKSRRKRRRTLSFPI